MANSNELIFSVYLSKFNLKKEIFFFYDKLHFNLLKKKNRTFNFKFHFFILKIVNEKKKSSGDEILTICNYRKKFDQEITKTHFLFLNKFIASKRNESLFQKTFLFLSIFKTEISVRLFCFNFPLLLFASPT